MGRKGRDDLRESRLVVEFGQKRGELKRREEADVETHVCAILSYLPYLFEPDLNRN